MQRRKFLSAAAALPLATGTLSAKAAPGAGPRQLIELRAYEMKFGGSGQGVLLSYLNRALSPTLVRMGCQPVRTFKEIGDPNPAMVYAMIVYPDAETYVLAQDLSKDTVYLAAASAYLDVEVDRPVYNRYTSSLLLAFTGMPEVEYPEQAPGILELRTYEGYSEDAVNRKIAMFNDEEIPLFHEVGLHPVFFGDMISGPYRPSLVYLLHFKDMEERDANWKTFSDHPDWKAMRSKEKYANSVSNIRRTFLKPV